MNRAVLTRGLQTPVTRETLIRKFCTGRSVLDIGCINHLIQNRDNPDWLHGQVKKVARTLLGVDYLESEVQELRNRGYDVICADATKPLPINGQFDVIVIGNLIEHLSSFEGLFANINCLLSDGGIVLISTANPFYREQYFYSAFRNDIIVNPEHTCWLDPVTLDQLARRFGLITETVEWIKNSWRLEQVVLNSQRRQFQILSGRWRFEGDPGVLDWTLGAFLRTLASLMLPSHVYTRLDEAYGKDLGRFLWLKAESWMFGLAWRLYRSLIMTAPINKFELYFSVLRPQLQSRSESVPQALAATVSGDPRGR